MNKNIGITDRIIRSGVAVLLIVLYATGVVADQWGVTILVIAGIMLLTALTSMCPIYWIFGINTCKTPKY